MKKTTLQILTVLSMGCSSLHAATSEIPIPKKVQVQGTSLRAPNFTSANGVRVGLYTGNSSPVTGGNSFKATVVLELEPGLHTYWQFPGDSGIPTKVEWQLPEGWTVGPTEFSTPEQFLEPGDMIIYGYEKQQLLRETITPPKDLPKDKIFV